MSYGLKYVLNIKSLKERDLRIEILLSGYLGSVQELTGGVDAFQVHIDDEDFLYTPLKLSTAKLSIIGEDYLRELYSTSYQQWKVRVYRDNALVWSGFIKPEIYTQDYSNDIFELEIECVSSISVLEHIEYETVGEVPSHVNLWMLLKRAIQKSKGDFNSIVIPHVYSKSKEDALTSYNIFEELKLNENNFFDDDEVMNWLEILEELCKILNWTLNDWNGSLVFLDVDHKGTYRKYNSTLTSYTEIQPEQVSVQEIRHAGNNHSLDILGGYNKATVKVDNNEVKGLLDLEENKELIGQRARANKKKRNESKRFTIKKFYRHRKNEFKHYKKDLSEITYDDFTELPDVEKWDILGATPIRFFDYRHIVKGDDSYDETTSYSFQDAINIMEVLYEPSGTKIKRVAELKRGTKLFTIKSKEFALSAGWVCINFTLSQFDELGCIHFEPEKNRFDHVLASLRIGDMYWNGKSFQRSFTHFNIPLDNQDTGDKNVKGKKNLIAEPYNVNGYIIPIESESTIGLIELSFYAIGLTLPIIDRAGYLLKNLELSYEHESIQDTNDEDEQDRVYTNVVNEKFVNELDEIEMKISTHNKDGICLSKLVLNDEYLKDNLYCLLLDDYVRLEELLIRRIRGQYSSPKYKLSQQLNLIDLPLIPVLSDKNMVNSRFIIGGGTLNYTADLMDINLIENDRQEN